MGAWNVGASFEQTGLAAKFDTTIQKRKVFEVARSQKSNIGRWLVKAKSWYLTVGPSPGSSGDFGFFA